jgi:1,4-alpha-glucan branching enzyme
MWAHPGKKLLFMGGEFGQRREWQHEESLEWHVLKYAGHAGVQRWVHDLNAVYRAEPALHELDCSADGFEWIDTNDRGNSTLSFIRKSRDGRQIVFIACNFTPVPRPNTMLGVPLGGRWREILNSDSSIYGGSGLGNLGGIEAAPVAAHGRPNCIAATLPPLGIVMFKSEGGG